LSCSLAQRNNRSNARTEIIIGDVGLHGSSASYGVRHLDKKGVLIVSFFYPPNVGGIETHLSDLTGYLKSKSVNVFVSTFQPLTSSERTVMFERREAVSVCRFPDILLGSFYRFDSRRILTAIRALLLTSVLFLLSSMILMKHHDEIMVIHGHNYTTLPAVVLLSRMFGKRAVMTVYDTHEYFGAGNSSRAGYLTRLLMSRTDSVIAISRKGRDEISLIADRGKITVLTFWIDLNTFAPPLNYLDKYTEGEFRVLYAGRLTESKGAGLMIRVASLLHNQKKIKFIFLGKGPLQNAVEKATEAGNVSYPGALGAKELAMYYSTSHVVVVPSIHEEGFGRVPMEAVACGTPVVVSKRGAIPEAVNEEVAIFVEPDAQEIADTICVLSSNPSKLISLARNCRRYAEEKFSERNALTIMKAYDFDDAEKQ